MRVISGTARGLKLATTQGLKTRPTTDRIKESLFNMIAFDLYDIDFLDLFSGSGAIGIEALSRGAKSCTFVDYDKECANIISRNLYSSKLIDKAFILNCTVEKALDNFKIKKKQFDIIFMDPPYSQNFTQTTLFAIKDFNLLKHDGFIISEQSSDEQIPQILGMNSFKVKEYKKTKIVFFKYEE